MDKWNDMLLTLAAKATEAGQSVYDFILEQSPELVKEIIFWGVFENSMDSLLNLGMAGLCFGSIFAVFYFIRKENLSFLDMSGFPEPWTLFLFFLVIPLALGVLSVKDSFDDGKQAAKAYFTPRIYLIEYTADLVKENKSK